MNFTVQNRTNAGKGHNRQLRAAGLTPGIIYGQGTQTLVSMKQDAATRFILSLDGVKQLVNLIIEDGSEQKELKVIVHEYQTSNIGNRLLHVDFLEVKDSTDLTVDVPIEAVGNPIGVKSGGVMQFVRRSIPVRCKAGSIPTSFSADISALDVGDSFHVLDIEFPEGVTPVIKDRNFTLIAITGRAAEIEEIDQVEIEEEEEKDQVKESEE